MKITQALKQKNRLIKEIKNIQSKIQEHNTVTEGETFEYDTEELSFSLASKVNELVKLKTAIHTSSDSMRTQIFKLSEAKSLVKFYNELPCQSGKKSANRYSSEVFNYVSKITKKKRDNLVDLIIKEIDGLQEQLDTFNATTDINLK